jgi:hypothetical protein
MSISQNFPSTRPSLNLNFARSQKLDPRITFTRSSTATYTGGDGLIKIAATNTPRFDFNATTGDCLGLLIEESRSNLVTYSDYSSGNSLANVTLSTNATTAPDGTNTAISMTGSVGTSVKYMYKGYSTTTTGTYTTSVFAKYNGEQYILLRVNDNAGVNDGQQRFDILNGIKDGNVANGGTATGASSTITAYPNGWYRLSVTVTFNSALTLLQGAAVYLTGYTTTSSTNSVYLWAPQLEAGAFATSYIPTVASTVTRTADNASMTGTNFSSWYNSSEGTLLVDSSRFALGAVNAQYIICEGGVNVSNNDNIIQLGTQFNANNMQFLVNAGGVNQVAIVEASVTSKSRYISSYKVNDFAYTKNGATPTLDTSGTVPTGITQFNIGSRPAFGNIGQLNGTISQLIYYPVRLSNSQLQTLTK